tara:strand:- start:370 stop:501 length:132 start_codon:yes stop_codon:yes gene_type:complete
VPRIAITAVRPKPAINPTADAEAAVAVIVRGTAGATGETGNLV